jgi:hypothetical protein
VLWVIPGERTGREGRPCEQRQNEAHPKEACPVLGSARANREINLIFLLAGLEDALNAINTGDFADIDEDGFELATVGNFEIGIDACV